MAYLVIVVVSASYKELLEGVFATAASFLGATRAVGRRDLGNFRRGCRGRGKGQDELMQISEFSHDGAPADPGRARALEAALRSVLGTAGTDTGEVRVFVREA